VSDSLLIFLKQASRIIGLCLPIYLASSPVSSETLGDVIRSVTNFHPDVQAAKKRLEASDHDLAGALADRYPEIFVTVGTPQEYSGSQSISSNYQVREAEVKLTHSLYDGGRKVKLIDAAGALRNMARYEAISAGQRVALDAVGAYLDVMRTEEHQKTAQEHLATVLKLKEQITRRMAIDAGLRSDLNDAENHVLDAQIDVIFAREAHKLARSIFMDLVGRAPKDLKAVTLRNIAIPNSLEAALNHTGRIHPRLRIAAENVASKRHQYEAALSIFSPTVDFEVKGKVSYNRSGVSGRSDDYSVGLNLNHSFNTGGAKRKRAKAEFARVEAALSDESSVRLAVRQQVMAAWMSWETARLVYGAIEEKLLVSILLAKDYEEQYLAGARDLNEAFFVEKDLLEGRKSEIDARYDRLSAAFGLMASTGEVANGLNR
jgi:outer membrane protein TolC